MDRRVDAYVEAVRERDALKRAVAADGPQPHLTAALAVATHAVKITYSRLTGSQVGVARRFLSAVNPEPKEVAS